MKHIIMMMVSATVLLTGGQASAGVLDDAGSFMICKAEKLYKVSDGNTSRGLADRTLSNGCKVEDGKVIGCRGTQKCIDGKCVDCLSDSDCKDGQYCTGNRECKKVCRIKSNTEHYCRESLCQTGTMCVFDGDHGCKCRACDYDSQCQAGFKCEVENGLCVPCSEGDDCRCARENGPAYESNGANGCRCNVEKLYMICKDGYRVSEATCNCQACQDGDVSCGACGEGKLPDGNGGCKCASTGECDETQRWNAETCACEALSCGKFGDTCEQCDEEECRQCKDGYVLQQNKRGCVCAADQVPVANGTCSQCTNAGVCDALFCDSGMKQVLATDGTTKACSDCSATSDCATGSKCGTETVQVGGKPLTIPKCVVCAANEESPACNCKDGEMADGTGGCVKPECRSDGDCLPGNKCNGAGSYNAACAACPEGESCNCAEGMTSNGSGSCKVSCTYEDAAECRATVPGCTSCGLVAGCYECTACEEGYFLKDNACGGCSLKFSHCANCTTSACTGCEENYKLQGGSCVLKTCEEMGYKKECQPTEDKTKVATGSDGDCYTCGAKKCSEINPAYKLSCKEDENPASTGVTGSDGACVTCTKKTCFDLGYETSCDPSETATPAGVSGSDGACYTCAPNLCEYTSCSAFRIDHPGCLQCVSADANGCVTSCKKCDSNCEHDLLSGGCLCDNSQPLACDANQDEFTSLAACQAAVDRFGNSCQQCKKTAGGNCYYCAKWYDSEGTGLHGPQCAAGKQYCGPSVGCCPTENTCTWYAENSCKTLANGQQTPCYCYMEAQY